METFKRMPFKAQKMLFEKLEEIGDVAKLPARERRMYERSLDIYRTNLAIESYAKERQKIAWEEGRSEGLQEGMEKGIFETARKMKSMHMAVDMIAACTGLTTEEIEAL